MECYPSHYCIHLDLIWHGTHQPWLLETRLEPAEHENEFFQPLLFVISYSTGLRLWENTGTGVAFYIVWHEITTGDVFPLLCQTLPHFFQEEGVLWATEESNSQHVCILLSTF